MEGAKEGWKKSYSSKKKDHPMRGFPSDSVKNLPVNTGDMGSIPGPGRLHMPQSN